MDAVTVSRQEVRSPCTNLAPQTLLCIKVCRSVFRQCQIVQEGLILVSRNVAMFANELRGQYTVATLLARTNDLEFSLTAPVGV